MIAPVVSPERNRLRRDLVDDPPTPDSDPAGLGRIEAKLAEAVRLLRVCAALLAVIAVGVLFGEGVAGLLTIVTGFLTPVLVLLIALGIAAAFSPRLRGWVATAWGWGRRVWARVRP